MTRTARQTLGSVDAVGGLWGPDLLAALRDRPDDLPGTDPQSYGLPRKASTEQSARAAWTLLKSAWEEFSEDHRAKIELVGDPWYGTDTFTLDRWTSHLLAQLGYQPTPTPAGGLSADNADPDDPGDHYPVTHVHAGRVPVHLLPAGVPLDRRSPAVRGAARQSPHSLVQDYLNRTNTHLWAVLTNGLTLRLLRDNSALTRQAHVEFDLAAIFDEGAYHDFSVLWHAAHATRFTPDEDAPPSDCVAERWQAHADKTGVAALDQMRDGVEHAIAELGLGLIEHRANHALRAALDDPDDPFDAAALYRELLYVAYRHVFWFAVDDRDLLHPDGADNVRKATYRDVYSSAVVREKARRHLGGNHPDGWEHHRTVAAWFASPAGQPALDIPALLGSLWDDASTPHLNDATITNRRYLEAVRRLAFVQRDGVLQRIDYRAMGSDELGAVYESLLEVVPVANPQTRKFRLTRTAGNERKTTGSYYTPTSLIRILLDEALDPVIERAVADAVAGLPDSAPEETRRIAVVDAILSLTVCDPAMGSAHFLVAAGHRLAKRVAQVRTGETEPSPADIQEALRDVAGRCLFGVDLNAMAVELAKIAIWLECHVAGKPLTFLDAHLRHGNALLGMGLDPSLMDWHRPQDNNKWSGGVPDDAFKALAGDDKTAARSLRDLNRKRRRGVGSLLASGAAHDADAALARLADKSRAIAFADDDSPGALAAKEQAWMVYGTDDELVREKLRADAWTACWVIPKTTEQVQADDQPFDVFYDCHYNGLPTESRPGVIQTRGEARRLQFFHWYVEFPDVSDAGGFDVMLGNPPWERLKLSEKEWFSANGRGEIAEAPTAAKRKQRIASLTESPVDVDRDIAARWVLASRDAQAMSHFARAGERFPLGGVGDVNTYALFADHSIESVSEQGRIGIVVPSGLVTDFTYRGFFEHLISHDLLRASHTALEIRDHFPGITSGAKPFTLLCMGDPGAGPALYTSAFLKTSEIGTDRTFALSSEELDLLSPHIKLAPNMHTRTDVRLALQAARDHGSLLSNWQWETRAGAVLASVDGTAVIVRQLPVFKLDSDGFIGLYEGKMAHIWTLAFATYVLGDGGDVTAVSDEQRRLPDFVPLSRHAAKHSVVKRKFEDIASGRLCVAWRDVANATNVRTLIPVVVPVSAMDNTFNIGFPAAGDPGCLWLVAALSTHCCDWLLRRRMSGNHVKAHMLESLPMPGPGVASRPCPWGAAESLHSWIASRAAALSITTSVMAESAGYEAPIIWDEAMRDVWRTEIDAAMFHIYGYDRDETDYVMDTFPIVRRNDNKAESRDPDDPDFRTKRLILAKYDELARHAQDGTPYISRHEPPALPGRLRLRQDAASASRA